MELLHTLIDYVLHMDQHLTYLVGEFGIWTYVILFLIIFCETGLVVTPFLPGDSLLFAVGALTAVEGSPLDLGLMAATLITAGIVGDAVNYTVGRQFGLRLFKGQTSRLLNPDHLVRTQAFYSKHGGKTIVLARYLPIIRTFAPFVAGMGEMEYRRFAMFNVVGAVSWVLIFLIGGHFFGNLPAVKENFHIVIIAIIVLSIVPILIEWLKARTEARVAGKRGS